MANKVLHRIAKFFNSENEPVVASQKSSGDGKSLKFLTIDLKLVNWRELPAVSSQCVKS